MPADIRLDGDAVVVEGKWARIQTWDLMLDGPGRRTVAEGERRALVHGSDDSLILNFRRDYPGGIRLDGHVRIPGSLTIGEESPVVPETSSPGLIASAVINPNPALAAQLRAAANTLQASSELHLTPSAIAPLTVHTRTDFNAPVRATDLLLREGDSFVSVWALVARLTARISELEERVAAIET